MQPAPSKSPYRLAATSPAATNARLMDTHFLFHPLANSGVPD
jgi:hypothetical protein